MGGAVIAVAGTTLLAGCVADATGSVVSTPASDEPSADESPDAGATASDAPSAYTDGDYEATGTYGGGPSFIGVSLTLADGRITSVEIETPATNETSLRYQKLFASGIGAIVVGRPIAELDVDNVAGSSSTVDGYNDAVSQIMRVAAS